MEFLASLNKAILVGGIAVSTTMLTACGGGSSSSSDSAETTGSGVFVDSPVVGLRYVSGDIEGVTDALGSFDYVVGQAINFYVGDILLGSAEGGAIVTPIDLVAGAIDETDPTVTNIIRFLQTLDDDGDPTNGILITDATSGQADMAINFDQSIIDFEDDGEVQIAMSELTALTTLGSRSLVTAAAAQSHFNDSLIGLLVGEYEGSFSGGDNGTVSFTINAAGQINGFGYSRTDQENFVFSGLVTSDGMGAAGSADTGSVFEVVFTNSGTFMGTWQNEIYDVGGSVSGRISD